MHESRPAFGQRLAELAELGVIEFRPEPLDDGIERLGPKLYYSQFRKFR